MFGVRPNKYRAYSGHIAAKDIRYKGGTKKEERRNNEAKV
jgi:hypothetical protein